MTWRLRVVVDEHGVEATAVGVKGTVREVEEPVLGVGYNSENGRMERF